MHHFVKHHHKLGKETSEIDSKNHAFWIGKMIPSSFYEEFLKYCGNPWRVNLKDEKVYNKEFLQGSLEYLFEKTRESQARVRILIGPILNEKFNDQNGAYTKEEQKEYIERITYRYFHKDFPRLDIIALEDDIYHKDLFETIEKEGIESLEVEKQPELSDIPTSLEITQFLLWAANQNEKLQSTFDCRTDTQKKEQHTSHPHYYSVLEIACRLAYILRGVSIHGGTSRQGVYDSLIEKIVSKGWFSYLLQPLKDRCKDISFETFYINRQENPYRKEKIRLMKNTRKIIWTAIAATTIGGISTASYFLGQQSEQEKQEKIRNVLQEKLENTTFLFEARHPIEQSRNIDIYLGIEQEIWNIMRHRYKIPDTMEQEVKSRVGDFLLDEKHKDILNRLYSDNIEKTRFVDLFVEEKQRFFIENKIEIQKPYEPFKEYHDIFKETLLTEKELNTDLMPAATGNKNYDFMGSYYEKDYFSNAFHFYLKRDSKNSYVIVKNIDLSQEEKDITKETIKKYFWDMRDYEKMFLRDYWNVLMNTKETDVSIEEVKYVTPIGKYKDVLFDSYEYDVGLYNYYENDKDEKYIVAKHPEDNAYSLKLGKEVAERYFSIKDYFYDKDNSIESLLK